MHVLAIGYSPTYLTENAHGIRQDWPRVPLPNPRELLLASAKLGRQVAALLDTESAVSGVTSGKIRTELKPIAVISRAGDVAQAGSLRHTGQLDLDAIRAGAEALGLTLEQALAHLGETTRDVYLNDVAYWKNVPARVWEYTIGGYQVMKKWLSYRERALLSRSLTTDEVKEVMNIARRIAALLLLEPPLDANYQTVKQAAYT
jgi:hypothetical protein